MIIWCKLKHPISIKVSLCVSPVTILSSGFIRMSVLLPGFHLAHCRIGFFPSRRTSNSVLASAYFCAEHYVGFLPLGFVFLALGSSVHGSLQARILERVAVPFPTQGSNLGLLHCRQILSHLSHQGSLFSSSWYPYIFWINDLQSVNNMKDPFR